MQVWCLLKGREGAGTFHGLAVTEGEAEAWQAGAEENWHYIVDASEGAVILQKPINWQAAENGELE